LQSSASAASAFSSSLAESEQDKTTLQRVVMNRPPPKLLRGVSDFTAADHLTSPAITQACGRSKTPRRPEPLRPDLNFFRNFDLKNPNYKMIANSRGL